MPNFNAAAHDTENAISLGEGGFVVQMAIWPVYYGCLKRTLKIEWKLLMTIMC